MQEREVTIAGQAPALGVPFHVLATQNPIEQEGTYPLPEAQLDRFLVQVDVPYPTRRPSGTSCWPPRGPRRPRRHGLLAGRALQAQTLLRRMPVGEGIVEMILDLVRACRPGDPAAPAYVNEQVAWGPGPRAAQALMLAVRAEALLTGRLAPSPEDVRASRAPCSSTAWR
jgi:MoxR-like ATPase